jgi:hypothetical protein
VDPELRAAHLRNLVAGGLDGTFDEGFRWVRSLGTPLDSGDPPVALPAGVVADERGVRLRRSRVAVERVAAVPCWLGRSAGEPPLRLVVPDGALGVSVGCLSQGLVAWLTTGAGASRGEDPPAQRRAAHLTWEEANAAVAALAELEGLALEIPSPDQWERAARGSDARRFPWGNAVDPGGRDRATPWGLTEMIGDAATWARGRDGTGVLVGDPADPRCASRRPPRSGERGLVRIVWRLAP